MMELPKIMIESGNRFKEALLLFGGGGVGKSKSTLDIARYCPNSVFWINDLDTSSSYVRLIYTEYQDILASGPESEEDVTIHWGGEEYEFTVQTLGNCRIIESSPSWNEFMATNKYIAGHVDKGKFYKGAANPKTDWWIMDSITHPWQYVQAWYSLQVHGEELSDHMVRVRKEASDLTEYNKLLSGDMTWPLINREYQRLITLMHHWRGHLVVTAEAQLLGKKEDEQDKMLFGPLGFKPAGQKSLHHQMSSNLFLYTTNEGGTKWRMIGAKDRGRELAFKEEIEDFAMDYLVQFAEWRVVPRK
jgi:hypothetical protein